MREGRVASRSPRSRDRRFLRREKYQFRADPVRLALTLMPWFSLTGHAADLSIPQRRLIDLVAYATVAKVHCNFEIDAGFVGMSYAKLMIIPGGSAEMEERIRGLSAANELFKGRMGSIECIEAFERYGPNGSEVRGLLRRAEP